MGKRRAEGRPYRAAGMESDASARLKRLTRAELIKLVTKLETPAAIVEREPGGEEKPLAPHKPTMLVNGSIRSGQIVRFEQGDLVIVGSVGSGAEIVAGGSIHIYGALRGRAYAGTTDHFGARIFCQKLEAELLGIAGLCRMSDDFESDLQGCPAHAWRDANDIKLGALCKLENLFPTDAVVSTAPQQAGIEEPQHSMCAPAQHSAVTRFSWVRPLTWVRRLTRVTPRAAWR